MSVQSKLSNVHEATHTHQQERAQRWRDEAVAMLSLILLYCSSRSCSLAQMQCTRKVGARQGSRWVQSDSCPARGHPCIVIIRWRGRVLGTRYRFSVTLLPVASLPPGQAGPDHATTANGHFSSRLELRPLPDIRVFRHPPPELTTAAVWADDTTSGSG